MEQSLLKTCLMDHRSSVDLNVYQYKADVRLPSIPVTDPFKEENANGVHLGLYLWDGRNALWESNKINLEGVAIWVLNPWSEVYGKVFVYTGLNNSLTLIDTGITVVPDTDWHQFELLVDFGTQKYISISVDGVLVDISNVNVAKIYRPNWGNEVATMITAESNSTWPFYDCSYVFTWKTQFTNIEFSYYNP
ncbi:MAG: hypothetical protein HQK77_20260 [Desulfobacterales bacterium]|nr:hypothetical protein [Desulfobacterales bacterium]